MPLPSTRKSISIGACRARHCAGTTSRRRNALHTMPMPGNPRGRAIRCICSGSEGGRRRASSVVADLPASHARPRCSCDAGIPGRRSASRCPRRPGLTESEAANSTPLPFDVNCLAWTRCPASPENHDRFELRKKRPRKAGVEGILSPTPAARPLSLPSRQVRPRQGARRRCRIYSP